MSASLLLEHALNATQLGVMLFLMAAGLTLVCSIMNLINLAHGSLYMVGAYLAAAVYGWSGSFIVALLLAVPATALLGMAIEVIALRTLYTRDHLDQVLCTFGLILLLNDVVRMIFGPMPLRMGLPAYLPGAVNVFGIDYPAFRLVIIGVGIAVAVFLYYLVVRTRLGMLIRAGASDRMMIDALGVNIRLLFTLIFGLGAALAGLAGVMAAPLLSVQVGMGDHILILTLVVIVIGGIGSVRGAFLSALLVGFIDTIGRVALPPAIAEMAIYFLMALVLLTRPEGLFAVRA